MFSWLPFFRMRAAVTSRARHSFSSMRRNDAPRVVKERETAALPINYRRNERPLSESLLFEMDLSNCCQTPANPSALTDVNKAGFEADLLNTITDIKRNLVMNKDFEKQLLQAFKVVRCSCEENGRLSLHRLLECLLNRNFAVILVEKGNRVKQPTQFCCCRVQHSFLLCFGKMKDGDGDVSYTSTPFILDPHFKSQFDVQHPSFAYSTVMESVPDVYIGSYQRLEELVRILCCQMQKSFEMAQCALPPWRTVKSMLSRWADPIQSYKQDELYVTGSSVKCF